MTFNSDYQFSTLEPGTMGTADNGLAKLQTIVTGPVAATVPAWEAFPEVNRVLVSRLLALLVERMARAAGGGDGGERGECCGEAALGAG